MKVYKEISRLLSAIDNCAKNGNDYWGNIHAENLEKLLEFYLPHGSGIDSGVKLSEKSTPEKLIFIVPFHCMNSNGYYDSWRDYIITVTPSLSFDFILKISGRDYNGLKDYLADIFYYALDRDVNSIDSIGGN